MASSRQAITSLLTEHFTYTPLTLIDDIINTVNELVYRAVTAVEEGLSNAPPESLGFAEKAAAENRTVLRDAAGRPQFPEARLEIQDGVHKLETLLEATVDKNFDKLELYVLRNILNIPEDLVPYIQLSHYKDLDLSSTENAQSTPEDLIHLRRKLQETRRLHNALQSEHNRNAQLISQLKALLLPIQQSHSTTVASSSSSPPTDNSPASLAFLTSDPPAKSLGLDNASAMSQQPLSAHAEFVASQMPALKQLLEVLKPRVEQLRKAHTNEGSEERREYIEEQTKRLLENRGADVETGEGLSRPATSTGRQVSADEVAAIEKIASSLGTLEES